ncbi:capsule biosynthesis protein [Xinfangfangia sp. CPCC 101601]|uniref:Capsule biosynthesis protein n=1 Tax=Pseudogemmobacter lacusdianii TaxID=3069608 RepID=A0ABU0VUW9_9RHOB|nr:capsule biosynthesis protein [Xinfangfangia sp. CPCC 101601]MDQ2065478.1 capsule biosynthesis protein [Xinfangfangia sp. CPCC 101601]
MTTQLKAARYNIRRPEPAARAPSAPVKRPVAEALAAAARGDDMPFATHDDGFGDQVFPGAAAAAPSARTSPARTSLVRPMNGAEAEGQLDAIRKEGLTGRQLRMARRLAQRHNLPATSDFDAVRLLRQAGVDPFQRTSMLDMVSAEPDEPATAADTAAAPSRALTALPGDGVRLPQTIRPMQLPSNEQRAEVNHAAEILKMQEQIARRRKKKLTLLAARMFVFIGLPTLIAAWYFAVVATPLYATKTEFIIQTAEPAAAAGLGGLLTGTPAANMQDSITVQSYLMSKGAMQRLEQDVGFRAAFEADTIDPVQRLATDASEDAAYKLYGKHMVISYDQSEGLVKMEVIAPDPALAVEWSKKLVSYAEEQVDHMSKRQRDNTMLDAQNTYEAAQAEVLAAQRRVIDLQEKFKVLSSEVEVTLLTQQIAALETQLTQERLSLAQMESNTTPNQARMEPVKRRIATLEEQIAILRAKLTDGGVDGQSLAHIQGELLIAQADVQTRQMMLAQSLQAMENSRIEASRQVRYLAVSVEPIASDTPAYPRAFENTLVTMLILLGIYLMISMTASILREQVSA